MHLPLSLPPNLRAPAFRLALAAVYAWGLGVGLSGIGVTSPLRLVPSFVTLAAAVAFGALARVGETARAIALFAVVPAAALLVPFEHERVAEIELSRFDFAAIGVALAIYLATALSFRGRRTGNGEVVPSFFDASVPADAHRSLRLAFYGVVAATTAAFLFGPPYVVPRAVIDAAWGDAANEAEVLSALASGAVAITWAGVLLRYAVRKPSASERMPTELRRRRSIAASAIGAILCVVAYFMRR